MLALEILRFMSKFPTLAHLTTPNCNATLQLEPRQRSARATQKSAKRKDQTEPAVRWSCVRYSEQLRFIKNGKMTEDRRKWNPRKESHFQTIWRPSQRLLLRRLQSVWQRVPARTNLIRTLITRVWCGCSGFITPLSLVRTGSSAPASTTVNTAKVSLSTA